MLPTITPTQRPAKPKKQPRAPRKKKAVSPAPETLHDVGHVHETIEGVASVELSPPHPPREDTPEYQQTHQLLVFDKDTPCKVCGVRHSTLSDTSKNLVGAKDIETHHYPVERSLVDAVDWRKVHNDYPAVYSQASLIMWVDSPQNMLVLCDIHHRGTETGIHHLPTQDFAIMPYLFDGYKVAATAQDAAAAVKVDEQIEQATGIEQQVDAEIAAAPARPKRTPSRKKDTKKKDTKKKDTKKKDTKKKTPSPAAA